MPTKTFEYSLWSNTRIAIPPTTTTTAVAVMITPAAVCTEGGLRRNFVIRRSIGFGRATRGSSRLNCRCRVGARLPKVSPVRQRRREGCRQDQEPRVDHDPEEDRHHDAEAPVVRGVPLQPV